MTAQQALLTGAMDYAGTFPPARLSLEEAAGNYLRYRESAEAWLLGRLVCPAGRVAELTGWLEPLRGLRCVSAVVQPSETVEGFFEHLADALRTIDHGPPQDVVGALELTWPQEALARSDRGHLANLLQVAAGRVLATNPCPDTMFLELPPPGAAQSPADWSAALVAAAQAVADYNHTSSSRRCRAGLKFRTGGMEADAVPPSGRLAEVLAVCRDRGVFWKATAGLHRPLRHFDPGLGTHVHGFINLLAAAALADVYPTSLGEIQAALDDVHAAHFHFTPQSLSWRTRTVTVEQIAAARRRGLRSFGTCSFREPLEGLQVLDGRELTHAV